MIFQVGYLQSTALIHHDIVVLDCVMDDVNTKYNPANSVDDFGNFEMPLPQIVPEIEVDVENPIPWQFMMW